MRFHVRGTVECQRQARGVPQGLQSLLRRIVDGDDAGQQVGPVRVEMLARVGHEQQVRIAEDHALGRADRRGLHLSQLVAPGCGTGAEGRDRHKLGAEASQQVQLGRAGQGLDMMDEDAGLGVGDDTGLGQRQHPVPRLHQEARLVVDDAGDDGGHGCSGADCAAIAAAWRRSAAVSGPVANGRWRRRNAASRASGRAVG